ncbi:MAG TPA: ABC transporter permease, partial [Chitinophagaceae bacterium]|nr:ABC transporter permease [Chitinophagaceae bacterium]
MIKNYFKIASRNIKYSKFFSLINICGLAAGMAVAILIGLWIYDELSYNHYHKNHDRIAQVVINRQMNGEINTSRAVPVPLGTELKTTYKNDFKRIVMAWWVMDHILSAGDKKISQQGTFIEPEGPDMFSLKMINGSTTALKDPSSIILSASAAKALFGNTDPVNQVMKIDNQVNVKVTGIYEDLP